MFKRKKKKKSKFNYDSKNKIFIISVIKIKPGLYNLKYILDNKVISSEYMGYLFFDVYTDNLNFIIELEPKMIGKWLLCDFDFYNVLLNLHNKRKQSYC